MAGLTYTNARFAPHLEARSLAQRISVEVPSPRSIAHNILRVLPACDLVACVDVQTAHGASCSTLAVTEPVKKRRNGPYPRVVYQFEIRSHHVIGSRRMGLEKAA